MFCGFHIFRQDWRAPHDAAWNLNYRTNEARVDAFSVDGLNQSTSTPDGNDAYDENGNLTNSASGGFAYEYDDENRLVRAVINGGAQEVWTEKYFCGKKHFNFMRIVRTTILFATLLCLCVTAFGVIPTRDIELKKMLVGKWFVETGNRRTELTNNEDGTFSSRTTIDGKEAWTTSGEWSVKDGRLEGIYRKASIPDFPIGEVDSSELLEVTKDYYVIKNRNGIEKKYQKMK